MVIEIHQAGLSSESIEPLHSLTYDKMLTHPNLTLTAYATAAAERIRQGREQHGPKHN